jgi:hypothetical protein
MSFKDMGLNPPLNMSFNAAKSGSLPQSTIDKFQVVARQPNPFVQQAPVLPMGLNPPLNMSFNAAKSGSAPVVQAPVEPIYTPPPRFEMKT